MTATNPPAPTTAISRPDGRQVAKNPINSFRDLLEKLRPQIQMALPKHIDLNRMIRICLTTIQRNPKLLDCTQDSLLGCLFQCVQLGLEPDGLLGHAYLIPFNDRKNNRVICTLIVGYKGLLKLARQSNEITSISARVVYSKDVFEYEFGLEEKLVHKPSHDEDPGEMTFAYAIFRLKGGGYHFDVMSVGEIDRIRDRSKAAKDGPWVTDYDEMAKKTVLRRASKMAPASIEDLARAVALDSRSDAGLAPALDIDMPAAQVPGSGEGEQGQRLSLASGGQRTVVSVPADDSTDTGEPKHNPVTGEVVASGETDASAESAPGAEPSNAATVKPRKDPSQKACRDLIKASTDARVPLTEVVKKYGVATIQEMDAADVARETVDLIEMAKVS